MPRPLTWLLAGLLASCAAPAAAGDSQDDRVTLTGLTPISVVVEELSPVAQKNGLTSAALQTDVERRLRQAGISLTPDADAYLYVHVTVADPGAALPLPYVVDVSLMQEVTLPRGVRTRTPLQCPTWSVNSLGLISGAGLRAAIADRVAQFADQFIRAYQSVNPKR
jgi:type IV pilus biogenesis protein CpaD/CtpE